MKQLLLYFSAVLMLLSSQARAKININTEVIERTVVFLYGAHPDGELDSTKPLGTGFLVGVISNDGSHLYQLLVTARHMVEPQWAMCSIPNPTVIYARLNSSHFDPTHDRTGVVYIKIPLRSSSGNTFAVSDDEEVDAAVIPLSNGLLADTEYSKHALPLIPLSDFASPEDVKLLGIGDAILSAGLLVGYTGEKRNYPIFKFGEISSIPDEPAWLSCEPGKPALRSVKIWFIAANLVPGNSGSPIYHLGSGGNGLSFGGVRSALLGVQSGSVVPADVAMMTPIEYVFEIIKKMIPNANLTRGLAK